MFPRIKGLQKPQKLERFEKFSRGYFKEMLNAPAGNCSDCKQVIPLTKGFYCGLLREKLESGICKVCPYFAPEPSEYRLFKRT